MTQFEGILAQGKFIKDSPTLERDLEDFRLKIETVQKNNGIKEMLVLTKKEADLIEVLVLPASAQAGKLEDLKKLGFQVSQPFSDISQISNHIQQGSAQSSFSLFDD